ncbi:putative N-acetyltransferase HLS1-like [Ananas comosus]|uniref:Putative N-acetyltransferase HLS1-like n=1 Tax=Ananas comosus TaxID=4615 RepID=A0A199VVB7_ANACO|nr:putative N-acetyltransferase HLS1-like [Ananas comosus]
MPPPPPSTTEFLPSTPLLLSHKLTIGSFLALSPASSSFALLSVFDSSPLLRLYAAPAPSRPMRAVLAFLRTLDSHVPWARLPSIPDVFKPFVCAAVVAEVARGDPVAAAVPRWRSFSSGEDVWCMKRLGSHEGEDGDNNDDDWVASPPSSGKVIFVDPREF